MKQVKLEKSIEAQIAQYDQNMLFQQAEYDANEGNREAIQTIRIGAPHGVLLPKTK